MNTNTKKEEHIFSLILARFEMNMQNIWILDSVATSHKREIFSNFKSCIQKVFLAANNMFVYAKGIGTINYVYQDVPIVLRDVLFVPDRSTNFISISKTTENSMSVILDKSTEWQKQQK